MHFRFGQQHRAVVDQMSQENSSRKFNFPFCLGPTKFIYFYLLGTCYKQEEKIKKNMLNSDKLVHAYSGKHDSVRQNGTAGRMHGHVHAHAQSGVLSIKKAEELDWPFPTKPVSHKRLRRTQGPFSLQDFEKTTLSTQQRNHLMPQLEYRSDGIRETTRSFHSQRYSQKTLGEEPQMTRAIQVKELLLKEKLCRVGEKIRQTIQSGSLDITADYELKDGKEVQYNGRDEWGVPTKSRISEYQRSEPLRRRDMLDGSLHEDLMQLRIKQDQRTGDRIRNKTEMQQARWDASEHKPSKEQNKSRLEKLNEPFRRKRGDDTDYGILKETGARNGEQNEASVGKVTWTRGTKYKETQKDTGGSEIKQKPSQKSLHRLATLNQRSTWKGQSNESTLPLMSDSLHQQQAKLRFTDTKGGSFRLLPCEFCKRTFQAERLEKHVKICAKLNLKRRQVFNSSAQRHKGWSA